MKDYRRKQVTIREIEDYSRCPRYYQLNKDVEAEPETHEEIFNRCIKDTIIHMYSVELTSGHRAEFHSIKTYWTKVFWREFPEDDAKLALEYSEKGIDIIYNHFSSVYSLSKSTVSSIRVPFDVLFNHEKTGVAVELAIVLVDHDNEDVYLVDFISKKDFPTLENAVRHSMESIIKNISIKKETPKGYRTKATFYDIADTSKGVTIEITDTMFKKENMTVKFILAGIDSGVIYSSRTCMCEKCEHKKQCESLSEEDE